MNWKYAGPILVAVVVLAMVGMVVLISLLTIDDEERMTEVPKSHATAWAKDMGASRIKCVPPSGCGTYTTYCDVIMPDGRIIALSCNTRGCHATGTVTK